MPKNTLLPTRTKAQCAQQLAPSRSAQRCTARRSAAATAAATIASTGTTSRTTSFGAHRSIRVHARTDDRSLVPRNLLWRVFLAPLTRRARLCCSENYLGHSLHGQIGRWTTTARGSDLTWWSEGRSQLNRNEAEEAQRQAERKLVKEAEEDAMREAM